MSATQQFGILSGELCSHLYVRDYNKLRVNALIDELNAKPYKSELFVRKQDAAPLVTSLCVNIRPVDEFLAAKTSHLINSIVTKQNLQFNSDYLWKVISWHVDCVKKCSEVIIPDILHNMQCILQTNPQSGQKFINELIGSQGLLTNIIDLDKGTQNHQIYMLALKCIISLLTIDEGKTNGQTDIPIGTKGHISQVVTKFLMKGFSKVPDEFIFCKIIISALRVLSYIHFNDPQVDFQMPDIMGICRHYILYGLVSNSKLEKIMPAQQTIAATPAKPQPSGGKKQKIRKQRNNAIESLKKEIPVSDRSLMKEVDKFENSAVYKSASSNYLESTRSRNCWVLTSDSDMSDVENSREVKLIALKSRVRQSAANLFLVVFKIKDKKDTFGYWWALLPDSPNVNNWLGEDKSKKTLAYCAVTDPIASSRASALSVILALLSGSKMYLSQAETSKKSNTSFIPFSVSLGYMASCMHKILVGILDSERSHAVIIVALKCCAALVQATPYHKMQDGLISELVRSMRKYLVHRDVTLQVGALITVGSVLSINPKVDEIIKAVEKDTVSHKMHDTQINKENLPLNDECDDFEEGYSDDEMFTAVKSDISNDKDRKSNEEAITFKSWILDICFKNMGWLFKDNEKIRCKPSAIPVILESLQVLSAIAFHHLADLLQAHLMLLADILGVMLHHEHQDVVLQAAKTISIIGDAIQKLEQQEESPPIGHCVYFWENLLGALSPVLSNHENAAAKVVVCDCIANIGERTFKELPERKRYFCCTLLLGSCRDEQAAVRAAAVRALAMLVVYRVLREDIGFVSDCGENILRALTEPTLAVRTKAAWALGNFSDALVLNMNSEDMYDDMLVRLLETSLQSDFDNDKMKMSFIRALGNLLYMIRQDTLERHPDLKALSESALQRMVDTATNTTNMKVRWNVCFALGTAMKNESLFVCFKGFQRKIYTTLCSLLQECKNLKVRINAATALRAPATRAHYGENFAAVWCALMGAMEYAANVADFTEYKHKDNLIEQLCVTLAHICCLMTTSDLADVLDPLVFHFDCAKALYTQLYYKLLPEHGFCVKILKAAKYVTMELTAESDVQTQALCMLQELFIWDV